MVLVGLSPFKAAKTRIGFSLMIRAPPNRAAELLSRSLDSGAGRRKKVPGIDTSFPDLFSNSEPWGDCGGPIW